MNNSSEPVLSPSITLTEIYGEGHVLNPRPSFSDYGWLTKSKIAMDSYTGSPLAIAEDMPVICSHYISTKERYLLFQMAKLKNPSRLYVYDSADQYQNILDTLVKKNKKLIINHVHPPNEIPVSGYWIDPELLAFLNNKANLNQLVSPKHVPRRMTIQPSQLSLFRGCPHPLVIKVATDQPTGGGHDVRICSNEEDLIKAGEKFSLSEAIVVEEFVPIIKNYCVQFAKTIDGEIIYLGAAEQITTSSGFYFGNWIDKDLEPPEKVIALGREIMEHACSMGYRGIAGFDIVETEDNRVLAIDLNFRLNGSTPALLLRDSIFKHTGTSSLLFRSWTTRIPFSNVLEVCRRAIKAGFLIPLTLYKPESPPETRPFTCLSGVLAGSSRQMIRKRINPMFSRKLK